MSVSNELAEMELASIEIATADRPDAAIIWLHGLGASNEDFVPIIDELRLPKEWRIRFIFPQAPSLPVTINGGMVMPAWYDILAMNIERQVDRAQLQASVNAIKKLIQQQIELGIASNRILLAGFSQGGAVAYEVALSSEYKLGGLMALSTYFATQQTAQLNPVNSDLVIGIFHGSNDPVVPLQLGQQAFEYLRGLGYPVDLKTYSMDHSVCLQEIVDIATWIKGCLPAS